MKIDSIEVRAVRKSALSPNARALYRALRADYAERLRSAIMSNNINDVALVAGRRIPPSHPLAQSWTVLDDALRELRGRCRGDGDGHDCT